MEEKKEDEEGLLVTFTKGLKVPEKNLIALAYRLHYLSSVKNVKTFLGNNEEIEIYGEKISSSHILSLFLKESFLKNVSNKLGIRKVEKKDKTSLFLFLLLKRRLSKKDIEKIFNKPALL